MNRIRFAVHAVLVLAVAFSAIAFFIPTEAKAGCFYPRRVIEHHWGYVVDYGSGPEASCFYGPIGPCCPAPNQIVGEVITECDGTVSSWGLLCPDNTKTYTREWCEPICD